VAEATVATLPEELSNLPSTIPQLLTLRAPDAEAPFVVGVDFRLTFGEAEAQSRELAGRLLASGVGKGTRVALLFPNNPRWVVWWLAITRIGGLSVPLSTFAPAVELARTIRHADASGLVLGPTFAGASLPDRMEQALPGLETSGTHLAQASAPFLRWAIVEGEARSWSGAPAHPVPDKVTEEAQRSVMPADALALISTSGATAAPKAVVHSHGSLVRHAALLARRRELGSADRIYSPMPFFWVGGLTMVLLCALTSGAAAVVQERFDAGEALDLIESERVTQISCWPNAARAMADHPSFSSRDLRSVRGGTLVEALPPEARPPSPDLAPMPLGMTETGGPHTSPDDPYYPLPEKLRGTFGRSLPGMEHRICDVKSGRVLEQGEGEIQVRGLFLMEGFYKRERWETLTPDGWYPTGDLGWFGSDGHLRFTGRRSLMIKTAGSNVSPAEVEAALLEIEGVRSAFVFGISSGERGQDVAAVVVANDEVLDASAIRRSLRSRLSAYKVPRHLRITKGVDLPMLPTGKADLVGLRSWFVGTDTPGSKRDVWSSRERKS
jgi:acyl-CoA synthetase (AMP-forming)/AMP-acid ligase II